MTITNKPSSTQKKEKESEIIDIKKEMTKRKQTIIDMRKKETDELPVLVGTALQLPGPCS